MSVVVITRDRWGARPPKGHIGSVPLRLGKVYIHHTADVVDASRIDTFEEECAFMRRTQAYHQDSRNYDDIGYSFVVMPSGRVFVGRGWRKEGGHTFGENHESYAWCFAGNQSRLYPTEPALRATAAHIKYGISAGLLSSSPVIRGHRDAPGAATQCPGNHLYARLNDIRRYVTTPEEEELTDAQMEELKAHIANTVRADVEWAYKALLKAKAGESSSRVTDAPYPDIARTFSEKAILERPAAGACNCDPASIAKAVADEFARRQAE